MAPAAREDRRHEDFGGHAGHGGAAAAHDSHHHLSAPQPRDGHHPDATDRYLEPDPLDGRPAHNQVRDGYPYEYPPAYPSELGSHSESEFDTSDHRPRPRGRTARSAHARPVDGESWEGGVPPGGDRYDNSDPRGSRDQWIAPAPAADQYGPDGRRDSHPEWDDSTDWNGSTGRNDGASVHDDHLAQRGPAADHGRPGRPTDRERSRHGTETGSRDSAAFRRSEPEDGWADPYPADHRLAGGDQPAGDDRYGDEHFGDRRSSRHDRYPDDDRFGGGRNANDDRNPGGDRYGDRPQYRERDWASPAGHGPREDTPPHRAGDSYRAASAPHEPQTSHGRRPPTHVATGQYRSRPESRPVRGPTGVDGRGYGDDLDDAPTGPQSQWDHPATDRVDTPVPYRPYVPHPSPAAGRVAGRHGVPDPGAASSRGAAGAPSGARGSLLPYLAIILLVALLAGAAGYVLNLLVGPAHRHHAAADPSPSPTPTAATGAPADPAGGSTSSAGPSGGAAAADGSGAAGQGLTAGTAEQVAIQLRAAGLPLRTTKVYTAATDPDHLLGTSGGYTSRVAFRDTRVGSNEVRGAPAGAIERGGAIEVFSDVSSAQRRARGLLTVTTGHDLVAEHVYRRGAIVLRVSLVLTDTQARGYETALTRLAG
ncbi:conserved hypothetical protein [Frankia sp. AiPs1]|uniref:hypothetical protein n=1 Tax=Frankia sp. AiPa1 TaxID=573492 RepID=UPI00202B9242|nr:hypothetical protein [Frankia sp. AiPa1]MCL9758346.1 hypothetical protein [Frankia sp. AiPa1]